MAMAEKKKKKTQDESKTPSEQPPKKEKSEEQQQKPDEDPKKSDDAKKRVPEIVMRVYMHCEGCARKIRRCLIGFDGVEEVMTDCKTHEVVVKGENADPLKVVDRVQKKTHRQVELLSAIPKPQSKEEKKKDVDENPKPEGKKEESKVVTVVLKIHMHCDPCSLGLKRKIEKMKGVEEAIPDLKSSTVSVKGTFEPPQLVDYVYKRTGKHAIIVKIDPPPPEKEKEGDKGKDGKYENKGGDEGEGDKKDKGAGGGGNAEGKAAEAVAPPPVVAPNGMEMRKNEYYYPSYYNHDTDIYAYEYQSPPPPPPQIFSDENPNACSIV